MDNFIEVYKNVFDDEFCKNAIEQIETLIESGTFKDRSSEGLKVHKEDISVYIPMHHCNPYLVDTFKGFFWKKCYKEYAEKYNILSQLEKHNIFTMKIQKTEPGQGYHIWHCEAGSRETTNRLLAWTVYLNDDFEAGETEFLYQQYRYKPSKGDCVIFPAAFTHTHRGNPPIGGIKYIITGWVEF